MALDERYAFLTDQRVGAFTRREALAAGYTTSQIRDRRERREWISVRKGVYALRRHAEQLGPERQHLLQLEALVLTSPDAAISHASAARWHGMSTLRGMAEGRLQATWRAGRHEAPWVGGPVDVHCNRIPDSHIMTVAGVRVTIPPRTVADVARTFPFYEGVVVGDSALATGLTTRKEIRWALTSMRRWTGVRRAREVTECLDARAANPLESIFHALWRIAGFDRPELQVWMYDADGFIGIADGAFLDPVVIYETDGAVKYNELAGPRTLFEEKQRQERVENSGAILRRYDWHGAFGARDRSIDRMTRALSDARRRPPPRLRLYVGDPDTPAPGGDAIRAFIRDPTGLGLTLAYDGLTQRPLSPPIRDLTRHRAVRTPGKSV